MTSVQDAVERFCTAFYSGDIQGTRAAVSPGVSLLGPFATVHNADELLQLAAGLMEITHGHRILRWVVAGNEVAALYEIFIQGPSGRQPLVVGGFFTVAENRVASGQIVYDSGTFDAIVNPS